MRRAGPDSVVAPPTVVVVLEQIREATVAVLNVAVVAVSATPDRFVALRVPIVTD